LFPFCRQILSATKSPYRILLYHQRGRIAPLVGALAQPLPAVHRTQASAGDHDFSLLTDHSLAETHPEPHQVLDH